MRYTLLLLALLLATPVHAASTTLTVPFTSEIPDGEWKAPWNNACEEAAVTMADQYYRGVKTLTKAQSKKLMLPLFGIEDRLFGYHADTDATETAKIINEYTGFSARIVENPTLEAITAELAAGRPVLTFHHAKSLIAENNRLRFRRDGSYYHVILLVGFDDAKKQFIVHDTGDHAGSYIRYSYGAVMGSLHDFVHATKTANGPARALFTSKKQLVRATGSHRVYLVANGVKRYITHPRVFASRSWSWAWVQPVEKSFVDQLPTGEDISS